jgi:hypothetical protein
MKQPNRRTILARGLTIAAVFNTTSCAEKNPMMSFVVFNYWPQAIVDVFVDDEWAGLADEKSSNGEPGNGGTIGPVSFKAGKKTVKWTLSGGAKTPRVREKITSTFDVINVGADHRYVAVHIYPDETVFIETSKSIPDPRSKK